MFSHLISNSWFVFQQKLWIAGQSRVDGIWRLELRQVSAHCQLDVRHRSFPFFKSHLSQHKKDFGVNAVATMSREREREIVCWGTGEWWDVFNVVGCVLEDRPERMVEADSMGTFQRKLVESWNGNIFRDMGKEQKEWNLLENSSSSWHMAMRQMAVNCARWCKDSTPGSTCCSYQSLCSRSLGLMAFSLPSTNVFYLLTLCKLFISCCLCYTYQSMFILYPLFSAC